MCKYAIICVGYNRAHCLKRLLGSLSKVDFHGRKDVDLIVSLDYGGGDEILDVANEFVWPFGEKRVRVFSEKQGLKKHMLQCFAFAEQYDCVAVLEDDIYAGRSLFTYLDACVEKYADDERIAGFGLYSPQLNWLNFSLRFEPITFGVHDAFFMRLGMSWGEAMTTRQWLGFKKWMDDHPDFVMDERMPEFLGTWPDSSWLKHWHRYCILNDRFLVYPYLSVATNFSEVGTHNAQGSLPDHQVPLAIEKRIYSLPSFDEPKAIKYDECDNLINPDLGKTVGLDSLCVDFYGTRPSFGNARYLLTTSLLPYRVVKSYALTMRPIEMNVLEEIEGEGIYVYDLTERAPRPKGKPGFALVQYLFRTHDAKLVARFSRQLSRREFVRKIRSGMYKIFRG